MIVLGISGGVSLPHENNPIFHIGEAHDAAAALLIDGKITGAIEEERLNRIKHTNKFPIKAIQEVLCEQNLTLKDVDYFSYYTTEEFITGAFKNFYYNDPTYNSSFSARKIISQLFKKAFDFDIDEKKMVFVDHHIAHAASAFYMSGFDESLILILDGVGERLSGRILYGDKNGMKNIDSISLMNSLGHYYTAVSNFIGYDYFDEYKVMGLAPYGNPAKYRDIFSLFYKLLPEGKFQINRDFIQPLLFDIGSPRRKGQEFGQLYKDVAASLQESLENIILHVLAHYSNKFGYKNLCLAGGVAHNCSANGKILYSGLFKNIFVQPAAHDAGNSIGAAIHTYVEKSPQKKVEKLQHVFFGTPVKEGMELSRILQGWASFIDFKKEDNIEEATAALIGNGKIIGWVQGKSEFGPRALGNRSIVADPRPRENRDIVNQMVKKREGYRPFAPSVLEERVGDYFDIGLNGTAFDYMTFVVKVRKEYQPLLGAITHVDGTARVQTVSQRQNPRYWNLINEFGKLSGIPMLLNTSFNNNVEPIVNTAEDAITCFLTTGLDHLVIGDYLISKKNEDHSEALEQLTPKMPPYVVLQSQRSYDSFDSDSFKYEIGFNYSTKYNHATPKDVFEVLSRMDGKTPLKELLPLASPDSAERRTKIVNEINELWGLRFITFLVLSIFFLCFCINCVKAQKTFTVNGRVINVKELNKKIEAVMDSTSTPGLSFALIDQNKVVFYHTYGYKRIIKLPNGKIKGKGKINKKTIFEACSLSKNFYLFAVERLLDQGLFNLDTPLCHYLEYPRLAYDERYKQITGRMVLSHSSGIENWQSDNNPGKLEILSDPGKDFIYSGEGYLYLSKVIEKLSGKSTETLSDELVIQPLKLTRTYTTMVKDGHMRSNYCLGHTKFLAEREKTKNDTPNIATWTVTTANDYANLLINFFNSKYLSQKRMDDIIGVDTTIHYPMMDKYTYWGPGFAVNYESGDTLLFQGGDNVVFKGAGVYCPRRKSGFVLFSNGENGIGLLKMLDSFTSAQYKLFSTPDQYPSTEYKILNAYNKQGYPAALSYFKTLVSGKDSSVSNGDLEVLAGDFLDQEPDFAANIALEYERRSPSSQQAVALHGKAMMKMVRYEAAIADFKKAILLDNASHTELESLITECSGKIKKEN